MNIAVAGVGGVGGYIGARLCNLIPEHQLSFIARGNHAKAIKKDGLKIIEDTSAFTVHPSEVILVADATKPFDLILLCIKSYDIAATIELLRHVITPQTVIIPFSNGVNHAETIRQLVDATVLQGAVYILSHIQEPGVIRKKGSVFAALFGDQQHPESVTAVAALFEKAGLRCKTPDDIETALWKKYLFIAAFANLTCYYDESIKSVYENHFAQARTLLKEIRAVANAKGVSLEGEVQKALDSAAGLPEDTSTSMHLDFQHGNQTELETLSGYIVQEANKYQIDTPFLQKIYTALNNKFKSTCHGP